MIMKDIIIKNTGHILCKSSFYTVSDILDGKEFRFSAGVNRLSGAIDSGIFGISYLISMNEHIDPKMLSEPLCATVNGEQILLSELARHACYMDVLYPLFSSKKTARALISDGLKKTGSRECAEDVFETFMIQDHHRDLAVKQTGNESVKVMAAVAYSHGKDVFCFPWYSKLRYQSFNRHMPAALEALSSLGKIAVLPLGTE